MKDGKNPHKPDQDLSPKNQTGEENGSIKSAQLTGRNSPEMNTPMGSETAGGVGGAGPHRPGRHR